MSELSRRAIYEKIYPTIYSIVVVGFYLYFHRDLRLNFESLIENSISIFGILIGFFITVLTIINSLDNQYIRVMRENGSFVLLQNYLKNAIWFSFCAVFIGLIHGFIWNPLILCVTWYLGHLYYL